MRQARTYDYYTVSVPGDMEDSIPELGRHAITEAEERARLHCIPCVWTATHLAGEVGDHEVKFRVCRMRRRTTRPAPTA
jgi:hypothetical protein